ncbi:MAG: nuclear transport factor 2 family protein [Candidatus Dormibacteria bacterium]
MSQTDSRQLAVALLDAVNERAWDRIETRTTVDVELRLPPGRVFAGREGVRDFLEALQGLIPDLTVVGTRIYAGDDFAVIEYESAGHGAVSAEGMGVLVLRVEGDRLSRVQLYVDTALWKDLARGSL